MVSARTVVTSGKINGTVTAAEKIQILNPAYSSATFVLPPLPSKTEPISMGCAIWAPING